MPQPSQKEACRKDVLLLRVREIKENRGKREPAQERAYIDPQTEPAAPALSVSRCYCGIAGRRIALLRPDMISLHFQARKWHTGFFTSFQYISLIAESLTDIAFIEARESLELPLSQKRLACKRQRGKRGRGMIENECRQ